MNPREKLDQLAAPDPTGARYNRTPAASPREAFRARIEYAKVIEVKRIDGAAWTSLAADGFGAFVLATPCTADGKCVAESATPQIWLKASQDALAPAALRVGVVAIAADDIIGFIRTDKRETVPVSGSPPVRGQVIPWAGQDGARLEAVPTPPHRHHFWATIGGTGPAYTFAEIGGESRMGNATEVNGVLGVDGAVVRVFSQDGTSDFEFEYGDGDRPPMERSYDFIEIWPARVLAPSASPLECRLWVPQEGAVPDPDDDWYLTAADSHVHCDFRQVGPGTFEDYNLIPCIIADPGDLDNWIQVRCRPGDWSAENAATPIPPDGQIVTFSGTLAAKPLPFTFTLEYEVAPGRWKRMQCGRTITAADDMKVALEGDGTGHIHFRTGVWEVSLADAPPAGAAMNARYLAVTNCGWEACQVYQTLVDDVGEDPPEPQLTLYFGWEDIGGGVIRPKFGWKRKGGSWTYNNLMQVDVGGPTYVVAAHAPD